MIDRENFQSLASFQGSQFEQAAGTLLLIFGWTILDTHLKVAHTEIDIVARDPDGKKWWIECKGSWRGSQPGLIRSDTTKKAVGVAYHLWYAVPEEMRCPYMLLVSHLPSDGSGPDYMLKQALEVGAIARVVCMGMQDFLSDLGSALFDDPVEDDD